MIRARLVLAVALLAAIPRTTAAQTEEGPEAIARTRGEEGLRQFQAGRWRDAYESFRSANASKHAPTLVLFMAHCEVRLNHLGAARKLYREVAREQLSGDAPLQFLTARSVAHEELEHLDARLGTIKVRIEGPPPDRARVRLDGDEVATADLDEIGVEPGRHAVEASIEGVERVQRQVEIRAGHTTEVILRLPTAPVVAPVAPVAPAVPEQKEPAPPPAPTGTSKLLLPAYVAFGAGGAALVVGAVAGGVSLSTANAVKSRCPGGGHCLASDAPAAATAGHLADLSTGAFVLAGLAAAGGATLLVFHITGRGRAPEPPSDRSALSLHLRPSGAALVGAF